MYNTGELYGYYINDILGLAVVYSDTNYLWCTFDFASAETKYFDITVPCYKSEVRLVFYYWDGSEWEHVQTGLSECDPDLSEPGYYYFEYTRMDYYSFHKKTYQ